MYAMAEDATTRGYTVTGMTCAHCVASVSAEVGAVPGVRAVDVDLASGRVLVHGERFSDTDVRAAVTEAGYDVAG